MKLSEAILLGSTVVPQNPGGILHDDGSGCALGLALAAAGKSRYLDVVSGLPRTMAFFRNRETVHTTWPWLRRDFAVPCSCSRDSSSNGFSIITHLFDDHVFGREDWTLERLVNWVGSVEPQEEASATRSVAKSPRLTGLSLYLHTVRRQGKV